MLYLWEGTECPNKHIGDYDRKQSPNSYLYKLNPEEYERCYAYARSSYTLWNLIKKTIIALSGLVKRFVNSLPMLFLSESENPTEISYDQIKCNGSLF